MTPTINVIAQLKRTKSRTLTLDGVSLQLRSLSLNALKQLQTEVEGFENAEVDPRQQFLPVLKAAVVGLEDVTAEDIGDFLLEDLKAIAEAVMNVGK